MEEQHAAVEGVNRRLAALVAAWRDGADVDRRDELAGVLQEFIPLLNEHLGLEEAEVVPLIERYITAAEYGAAVAETGAGLPPETLPLLFGMNMYEGDPAIVADAIALMPEEIRPVIGEIAVGAYATYAENLYGTPTPPRIGRV
jgi:hypothetical protein